MENNTPNENFISSKGGSKPYERKINITQKKEEEDEDQKEDNKIRFKIESENDYEYQGPKNNQINEIEEKIDNLKELQNNQAMIEILQIAHKAFYPLFIYYTNENEGLMSNKNFMKFTKDFEIFPYLIGKAKLNSFFNGISQYSMYGQKDSALIEHSLFVDLIALMALEMNYPSPEPSPVEKILIFIEKISQSQGPGKIALNTGNNRQSNCGNILELFKEKYPGYFAVEKSTEDDFSSIMQNDNDEDNEVENENNENNNYEENEEKNNEKGGDDDNIQKDNINSINSNIEKEDNVFKSVSNEEINNMEIYKKNKLNKIKNFETNNMSYNTKTEFFDSIYNSAKTNNKKNNINLIIEDCNNKNLFIKGISSKNHTKMKKIKITNNHNYLINNEEHFLPNIQNNVKPLEHFLHSSLNTNNLLLIQNKNTLNFIEKNITSNTFNSNINKPKFINNENNIITTFINFNKKKINNEEVNDE